MKPLNFNKVKKTYLTVTFSDEDNTTIMIGTPTKAIMDDLLELQDELNNINEDETDLDSTDNLYSACAKVMSRNKGGVKISKEFLEEIFDLVAEYTGLNILQVQELDYLDYLQFRRDAFIHRLSQTEDGVKYLDNAWRLEQTKPDREALRSKFGKEG